MPMGSPRIYADYNATAPVTPRALAKALEAIEAGGNASSVHAEGRRARSFIETARRQVAALMTARPEHVCFTSGGTEAANLGLRSIVLHDGQPAKRLLVGTTEHAAVLAGHASATQDVEMIPVLGSGEIDLDRLHDAVRDRGPAVLALQAANNETGVVQPVKQAGDIVRAKGGILVCDAVQAAGRIACDAEALGADIILLSGHKLGGLKGAGAVVTINRGIRFEPLVRGGGQERGLRGGTENVAAIASFGVAADDAGRALDASRLAALRNAFEAGLKTMADDAVIFGAGSERLPNTSAFAVPGVGAERLMMALDLGGVAVSSGSACSSGKVGRSHVLEAMGIGADLRSGAIRVSFGWQSVASDVDAILAVLKAALLKMRRPIRSAA